MAPWRPTCLCSAGACLPPLTGGYDADIAELRDRLGDAEFEVHRVVGASMNRSQAVDVVRALGRLLATDDVEPPSAPSRKRGPRANPELTEREREVLAELVHGHTNQAIAVALGIAPKTVMHHTVNVYRKLGVRGRAEAITHALRTGLVPS